MYVVGHTLYELLQLYGFEQIFALAIFSKRVKGKVWYKRPHINCDEVLLERFFLLTFYGLYYKVNFDQFFLIEVNLFLYTYNY
jgi:hypothetical protein